MGIEGDEPPKPGPPPGSGQNNSVATTRTMVIPLDNDDSVDMDSSDDDLIEYVLRSPQRPDGPQSPQPPPGGMYENIARDLGDSFRAFQSAMAIGRTAGSAAPKRELTDAEVIADLAECSANAAKRTKLSFERSDFCTDTADSKNMGSSPSLTNGKDLKNCAFCRAPADLVCSGCYMVVYCCADHQEKHWTEHEVPCSYFALRRSPQLAYQGPIIVTGEGKSTSGSTNPGSNGANANRFQLTALVQIPPREKVLDEIPVLIAPWPRISLHQSQDFSVNRELKLKSATCFNCCNVLSAPITCCKCNLPVCSIECSLSDNHAFNECEVITNHQASLGSPYQRDPRTYFLKYSDQDVEFLYEDVMICRLILMFMREEEKKLGEGDENGTWTARSRKWNSLLKTWKCETERRLQESVRGEYAYKHLAKLFPLSLFLINDKETIWKLFCIIETNAFKYQLPFKRFNVLCSVLSTARHSCAPNAHTFLTESAEGDLIVRAVSTRKIEKGEAITFSYVPVFYSFMERRLLLLDNYLFWCRCLRCMDPHDYRLYTASFPCPCKSGYIVPPKDLLEKGPGAKPRNISSQAAVSSARTEYYDSLISHRYNWRCTKQQTGDLNPFYHSASKSETASHPLMPTRDVFNNFSDEDTIALSYLDDVQQLATYMRMIPLKIHQTHSVLLKLMEDLLRGEILDLTTSVSIMKIKELQLISSCKRKFESFMITLNPGFAFEGYPIETLAEIKSEYDTRMKSFTGSLATTTIPTSVSAAGATASARSRRAYLLRSIAGNSRIALG